MRQKEKKEQELEEKLCYGYALFLVWPVVASENNAFIWDFLSFYESKDCPKLESDQFRSLKIHKKLGFQTKAKIFAAFFLIPYRDYTKWKTLFGVIDTLSAFQVALVQGSSNCPPNMKENDFYQKNCFLSREVLKRQIWLN